jgi:hypothetical protein
MNLVLGAASGLSRTTFKIVASYEAASVVVRFESTGNNITQNEVRDREALISEDMSTEKILEARKCDINLKIALVLVKKMNWLLNFRGEAGRVYYTFSASVAPKEIKSNSTS